MVKFSSSGNLTSPHSFVTLYLFSGMFFPALHSILVIYIYDYHEFPLASVHGVGEHGVGDAPPLGHPLPELLEEPDPAHAGCHVLSLLVLKDNKLIREPDRQISEHFGDLPDNVWLHRAGSAPAPDEPRDVVDVVEGGPGAAHHVDGVLEGDDTRTVKVAGSLMAAEIVGVKGDISTQSLTLRWSITLHWFLGSFMNSLFVGV